VNGKVNNQLTIFKDNVVGHNIVGNFLFGWLGFMSAANVEQVRMLQDQIVLDVSQFGSGVDCQAK
jgi:hypothetical protein